MGHQTEMLGEKVVLCSKGIGLRMAQALIPGSSSLTRVVSLLPWTDKTTQANVPGELIHFVDKDGGSKVLLQEVAASMCVSVVHELFEFLLTSAPVQSPAFTLIIPAITRLPGSILKLQDFVHGKGMRESIHVAILNDAQEGSRGVYAGLPRLPSTVPIRDDFLACLLHFVHTTGLPALLLLGPRSQGTTRDMFKSKHGEAFQVLHAVGDIIAQQVGLTYSDEKAQDVSVDHVSASEGVEDDWQRLYI